MHRRLLPAGMVKLELVPEADEADLLLRAADRAREVRAEQAAPCVSAETPWPSRAAGGPLALFQKTFDPTRTMTVLYSRIL